MNPFRYLRSDSTSKGLGTFLWIFSGQVLSMFGSALTSFGVGVWVLRTTGSVTDFGLLALAGVLPGAVLSPLAGALVDRWDRRRTLLAADLVGALVAAALVALVAADRLAVWQLYLANVVASVAGAFQFPAFAASTPLLIPKRHLARASGLLQTAASALTLFAPLVGALLLEGVGLTGLVALDFASYLLALLTLATTRIPQPPRTAAGAAGSGTIWRETAYGWHYVRARPGLLALLVLFAAFNFASGMVNVLITPLVLSFADTLALGTILTVGSTGSLAGAILMAVWGGPRRKVPVILAAVAAAGAVLLLAGLPPSVPLVTGAIFGFLFCFPVVTASSQAIWQGKVELDVQGRVFAVRRMVALGAMPLALALAGPLADHVFEPALAPGGRLAATIGQLVGVGEGRGLAAMIVLMGLLVLATVAVAARCRRLRHLEDEVPDAVEDEPAEG